MSSWWCMNVGLHFPSSHISLLLKSSLLFKQSKRNYDMTTLSVVRRTIITVHRSIAIKKSIERRKKKRIIFNSVWLTIVIKRLRSSNWIYVDYFVQILYSNRIFSFEILIASNFLIATNFLKIWFIRHILPSYLSYSRLLHKNIFPKLKFTTAVFIRSKN